MTIAEFRFYEELNDFLRPQQRKQSFAHGCARRATVKNAIESLGVPHTEVEFILVNGCSVDFSYLVREGDRISVYPQFETFDVAPLLRVRPSPLRCTRFIADAHLGRLAKYLRLLGFDTLYRNDFADAEIATLSQGERRIVLTRDRDLLMHGCITHGCYVREVEPLRQVIEIVGRLDLKRTCQPFSRCSCCNEHLYAVPKDDVRDRLAPPTLAHYDQFWRCHGCARIYWAGSHYQRLRMALAAALAAADKTA
jgi:uncharacterized protein with PIN domain